MTYDIEDIAELHVDMNFIFEYLTIVGAQQTSNISN